MISVAEAKTIIKDHIKPLDTFTVAISVAAGLVLSEDVFSCIDIPSFDQSSMDGYAFSFKNYVAGQTLMIAGEVPAGVQVSFSNLQNKAVRIFTGAPVPIGADTVVMQEKVSAFNDELVINDDQLKMGMNVRLRGSEIRIGDLALTAGTQLTPGAIGFLAGMGLAHIKIIPGPRISLIVTGKELQQPGLPLAPGQVYESNSLTLKAALRQCHFKDVNVVRVDDDLNEVKLALENALASSDMVLLTGGISVGDYDFVLRATELCGVTKYFHKVKQKPGKPLYFGKAADKVVFGLPGNPSSVLTCFYEYVTIALEQLTLQRDLIKATLLPLATGYTKKKGLTHFLKGHCGHGTVMPMDAQESYRLSSFARANCLIMLDEDMESFEKGDMVQVHILN